MQKKKGRKSLKDELKVLERYADLSKSYFFVLKDHLESSNKSDREWAVDHLKNAFVKMIPQEVSAEEDMPFTLVIKPRDAG